MAIATALTTIVPGTQGWVEIWEAQEGILVKTGETKQAYLDWKATVDIVADQEIVIGYMADRIRIMTDEADVTEILEVDAVSVTLDPVTTFVAVNHTATAAVTVNLPSAADAFAIRPKAVITVSDTGANASVNNITIARAGSDTIVDVATGQTSTVLVADGATVRLRAIDATTWKVF